MAKLCSSLRPIFSPHRTLGRTISNTVIGCMTFIPAEMTLFGSVERVAIANEMKN
jgi:hypothetical protein